MRPIGEQTILVTGATDGLGRALAQSLAGRGATLLVHGRDAERLEQVAGELGARAYRAGLASLDEVRAMAGELLERETRIDTLVNNAGIGTTLSGGRARGGPRCHAAADRGS